jgi:glyoxylase-like metal-dependent hydrolase (beta-lactamase superfamily II)
MPVTRVSRFGFVNVFLVREDDGLTVVDTGIPRSTKAIVAAAQDIGAPIKRIALTHAHGDHIGSLDELVAELGDVEVLISARDARLMGGDKSLDPGEEGKLRGSYPGAKTRPTRTLAPGDRVGSLEVVPSPGHTPGHISFLDTRDRTLYCGDVFSTIGGVATSAKPYAKFPLPATGTWNRDIELQSAREMRALDPARLAPGHGKVVESPAAAMDAAIARGA